MGFLDQETMFADSQSVTATGDTPSTNYYDFAAGTQVVANNGQADIGLTGEMLFLNARVQTTFTSGGAATLQVVWQDSPDATTWTDRQLGAVTPLGTLTAGYDLFRSQPSIYAYPGAARYGRFVFRVATAAMTAGKIDAFVSLTVQRNIARASGFSAS